MEWNGIDVELWIDRRRIYQTTTTCFTHGILFCILLAFPIERLYYALLAASNANFHDPFIIPVILFTIFYHSPQESFVIKNECEVFVVFCGITTRSEKKKHIFSSTGTISWFKWWMLSFKEQDIFHISSDTLTTLIWERKITLL